MGLMYKVCWDCGECKRMGSTKNRCKECRRLVPSKQRSVAVSQPSRDRSISYQEYLHTEWWFRRRRRALRLAGWKCVRCGDDSQLEVHHLSYKNLWKERDDDLEVLCSDCHYGKHAVIIEMDNHLRSIMNSVL